MPNFQWPHNSLAFIAQLVEYALQTRMAEGPREVLLALYLYRGPRGRTALLPARQAMRGTAQSPLQEA